MKTLGHVGTSFIRISFLTGFNVIQLHNNEHAINCERGPGIEFG